jgi:alkyl hydroperoxide reductase subunit AhpC
LFAFCFLIQSNLAYGVQSEDEPKEDKKSTQVESPDGDKKASDDGESGADSDEPKKEDDEPKFDFLKIGQKAPDVDAKYWLTDNNGLLPKFKKFESGSIYVIHFFITDNEYTTGELANLVKLQRKYENKNVQVVAVSFEDQESVEKFLDEDLPKSIKKDDEFKSLDTYYDLATSISTVSDPDRSIWNDYQDRSGRTTFSAFIIGKKGEVEWIGAPTEVGKTLGEIVSGKWDRKKYAKALAQEQKKNIDQSLAANRFAKWQQSQFENREGLGFEDLKKILADGFKDPKNESFKFMIQRARLELLKLTMDSELPEVMMSYTDLVSDPTEGTALNNIAWEIYELYEAGRVQKNSEVMQAAMYMAEKAIKLEPNSGAINDTIAHFVYLLDGDLDKAIEYQKKALKNAEGGRTEDLQPFLDFLLKEKETGKKKSLQKNGEAEEESDF